MSKQEISLSSLVWLNTRGGGYRLRFEITRCCGIRRKEIPLIHLVVATLQHPISPQNVSLLMMELVPSLFIFSFWCVRGGALGASKLLSSVCKESS